VLVVVHAAPLALSEPEIGHADSFLRGTAAVTSGGGVEARACNRLRPVEPKLHFFPGSRAFPSCMGSESTAATGLAEAGASGGQATVARPDLSPNYKGTSGMRGVAVQAAHAASSSRSAASCPSCTRPPAQEGPWRVGNGLPVRMLLFRANVHGSPANPHPFTRFGPASGMAAAVLSRRPGISWVRPCVLNICPRCTHLNRCWWVSACPHPHPTGAHALILRLPLAHAGHSSLWSPTVRPSRVPPASYCLDSVRGKP